MRINAKRLLNSLIVCVISFLVLGQAVQASDENVNETKSVTTTDLDGFTATVSFEKKTSIFEPLRFNCSNYKLTLKDKDSRSILDEALLEGYKGKVLGPTNVASDKEKIYFEFLLEGEKGDVGQNLIYEINKQSGTVKKTEKKHKHPLGCWHSNFANSKVVQTSSKGNTSIKLSYNGMPDWYAKTTVRLAIERGRSGKVKSMKLPSETKYYMINVFITDINGDNKLEVVLAGHAINDLGSLLKVFSYNEEAGRFKETTLYWGDKHPLPKISDTDNNGILKFKTIEEVISKSDKKDYLETTLYKFENEKFVELSRKKEIAPSG